MKHILLSIGLLLSAAGLRAELDYLEQISVETFAKMREVERFQIKVAEKLYLKGEYKAAASEYEKFLTLYERSTAAPYAQLMWSHCLVKQRKVYTAIKDGFQSVVDYWPESHEAMLAGFLIGHSYQSAGELQNSGKISPIKPREPRRTVTTPHNPRTTLGNIIFIWEIFRRR